MISLNYSNLNSVFLFSPPAVPLLFDLSQTLRMLSHTLIVIQRDTKEQCFLLGEEKCRDWRPPPMLPLGEEEGPVMAWLQKQHPRRPHTCCCCCCISWSCVGTLSGLIKHLTHSKSSYYSCWFPCIYRITPAACLVYVVVCSWNAYCICAHI